MLTVRAPQSKPASTARQVEANGDACYLPELLRIKGGLLLAKPEQREGQAESCFIRSLETGLPRRQGGSQ